jgi:hypothetical protein
MLVPAMTINEIRRDIDKDYPSVKSKASYMAHKVARIFGPGKDKNVVRFFEYCSFNKNKWIYKIQIHKKQEHFLLFTYYYNNKGLNAFSLLEPFDYLLHFTGHFFARYNQRLQLNLVQPNDIIRAYMEENSSYTFYKRKIISKGIVKIFCLTEKGIILGTQDDNTKVYHMNTFIPYFMLSNRKIKTIEEMMDCVIKMWNDSIRQKITMSVFKCK